MANKEFTLDREEMVKKQIDATGKKWHIKPVAEKAREGLCLILRCT